MPPWRMSAPVAVKNCSTPAQCVPEVRAGRCIGPVPELLRQPVALISIEHGVALHERDFAQDFLALIVGLGAGQAVGIDDQFALFALADIAAEFDAPA